MRVWGRLGSLSGFYLIHSFCGFTLAVPITVSAVLILTVLYVFCFRTESGQDDEPVAEGPPLVEGFCVFIHVCEAPGVSA